MTHVYYRPTVAGAAEVGLDLSDQHAFEHGKYILETHQADQVLLVAESRVHWIMVRGHGDTFLLKGYCA